MDGFVEPHYLGDISTLQCVDQHCVCPSSFCLAFVFGDCKHPVFAHKISVSSDCFTWLLALVGTTVARGLIKVLLSHWLDTRLLTVDWLRQSSPMVTSALIARKPECKTNFQRAQIITNQSSIVLRSFFINLTLALFASHTHLDESLALSYPPTNKHQNARLPRGDLLSTRANTSHTRFQSLVLQP
jgi:hypothetical protein